MVPIFVCRLARLYFFTLIYATLHTLFLSDPSPIIGNACHSITNLLTNSCLVNLIDVTLACEDANSKLVDVVTDADIDNEDHVGNSLFQIWNSSEENLLRENGKS